MRLDVRSYCLNSLARALYEPDDELNGIWTREQLLEMNARFVDRLEQAFKLGLESRKSAAGQVKLPASSGAVQVTPLCPTIWSGLLRSAASGGTVFVARG
jgi:hypothetical protein